MVNTCAVMTGLIISYINNTILAYLALFGFTIVAILQSGKFTFPAEDKIGSIQEISIYSVLLLLIFQMKQL